MPDPTKDILMLVGHSVKVRASSQPPTKAYHTPVHLISKPIQPQSS